MCAEQILNPDKATTFPARNIVGNRIDAPKVVTEVFARLGSHKEAITRHINRQISGKLTRADKDASRKSAPRTPPAVLSQRQLLPQVRRRTKVLP